MGWCLCAGELVLMLWSKINSDLQFIYVARIYLLKITNGNTRWMCEICWKLTIKTSERCHWCHSGILTVNFKHISHLALVFLMFFLLLFVRNIQFIVDRSKPRTRDTSKMELFAKIVYSLKLFIILTRSSILRSNTGCWIYFGYFFRFTFHLQFFYWFISLTLWLCTFLLVYIVCIDTYMCLHPPL